MSKMYACVFFTFLSLMAAKTLANTLTEELWFSASSGEEVRVSYSVTDGVKSLIIYNRTELSEQRIIEEFATAAFNDGHYNDLQDLESSFDANGKDWPEDNNNHVADSQQNSDPDVIIFRERGSKLVAACRLQAGLCRDIADVEFSEFDKRFAINFPAPDPSATMAKLQQQLQLQATLFKAVNRLSSQANMVCQVQGNTLLQLTCRVAV